MTTPPLETLLNIVQVMQNTISSGGKIALHCHAGLGRTGLVIACYLVYSGMPPQDAIQQVRIHR